MASQNMKISKFFWRGYPRAPKLSCYAAEVILATTAHHILILETHHGSKPTDHIPWMDWFKKAPTALGSNGGHVILYVVR